MQCKECLMLVVSMALAIASVDAACGPEVSPWIAYLVPVVLASRYCGFRTGALYATLGGLLIGVVARHTGHPYTEQAYFLIAVISDTAVLVVVAWLVSRLSALEQALRKALANPASIA